MPQQLFHFFINHIYVHMSFDRRRMLQQPF